MNDASELGKMWLSCPPHAEEYPTKNQPLVINEPNNIVVGSISDSMKEKYFCRVSGLPGLHLVLKMDGPNSTSVRL